MAIDFDAIRKKLNQLSGVNNKRRAMWRPQEGETYNIRIIGFAKKAPFTTAIMSGIPDLPYGPDAGKKYHISWYLSSAVTLSFILPSGVRAISA